MTTTGNGRDEIRAKIFAAENRKFKRESISLFNADVEIRQPTLGMILDAQQDTDRKKAMVKLLVDYCFVPGTDIRVFEDADMDSLLSMPFGDDLLRVNQTIAKLTNIDVLSAEGNSVATSGDSMS